MLFCLGSLGACDKCDGPHNRRPSSPCDVQPNEKEQQQNDTITIKRGMTDSVTSGVSSQQQKASRVTVGIIFGGRDQPNIIQHVITSIGYATFRLQISQV